jgi:hypothetical protein
MGLYLRRVVLQHPREGWQGLTGISGSFQSEWMATFNWNGGQGSTGMSGNLRPEYASKGVWHALVYFEALKMPHTRVVHSMCAP